MQDGASATIEVGLQERFHILCADKETDMERRAPGRVKSRTGNKPKIKKPFLGLTKDEKEALLKEATEEAIAETHAAGYPTAHGDERGVYLLYPDGHREYIKRYPK